MRCVLLLHVLHPPLCLTPSRFFLFSFSPALSQAHFSKMCTQRPTIYLSFSPAAIRQASTAATHSSAVRLMAADLFFSSTFFGCFRYALDSVCDCVLCPLTKCVFCEVWYDYVSEPRPVQQNGQSSDDTNAPVRHSVRIRKLIFESGGSHSREI